MRELPSKQDYLNFLSKFTDFISKEFPEVCFYTFGSISREDFICGRSDIDGNLILNSGVITSKGDILKLSKLLADSLGNKNIKTQFNLLDREICKDGRFNSYTEDYTDWLKKSSEIRGGPDYISEMKGRDYKSAVLNSASFNFCGPHGIRSNLLYSAINSQGNKKEFIDGIETSIEKVAKFPRKLLWLRGDEINPSRRNAKAKLENSLNIDLTHLDKLNHLLDNPEKLYQDLEDKNNAINLLSDSLTCIEEMIDSYIKTFPKVSKRELKG